MDGLHGSPLHKRLDEHCAGRFGIAPPLTGEITTKINH
ncbi:hypothetical protein STTU_p0174 (plasmid) [Streptomyces sp. Tu6071]|nr:hypothetical protein STTU_p0174 [Streptomyces sp. Tu6071]